MDLKNEVSMIDLVNAFGVFVSGFIALMAYRRSRSSQKREDLARKALAYHDILEVLKKGNGLTIDSPQNVSTQILSESHSAIKLLIEEARKAFYSVSAAFPIRVLALEDLIENAETLIRFNADLERNKESRERVIRAFRTLYTSLFVLSAEAAKTSRRGELGDTLYDPTAEGSFFQLYRERAKAFQKESERLSDQHLQDVTRMIEELKGSFGSEAQGSGRAVTRVKENEEGLMKLKDKRVQRE